MTAKSLNASSAATTRKITLNLSENAYQGDAQFSVTVDNIAIGGVLTVTAPHGTGQSQAFVLPGTFDLGAHDVAVTFLNDRYDGTPQTDRNLYFDSVLSDAGTQTVGEGMFSTGDVARTTIPAAASSGGLVLSMAEDAYQGDAQFTATVDGTQVGGVQTVTASHTAGKVQAFDLGGDFAKGAHVVAITFLNDAYGGLTIPHFSGHELRPTRPRRVVPCWLA